MIKKTIFSVLLALFFIGCNTNKKNEIPIAEVGEAKLYYSDIKEYFQGLTYEDSVTTIIDYANRWAKNQVVLQQAEKNLTKSERNLTVELENYKTSLLIYKYEQAYILEKMDTIVRSREIEQFYNNNPENFQLPGILIKALLIKIPNDFPQIDKIRQLYRSNREKDIEELAKIALQGAEIFDFFDNEWIDLETVAATLPANADSYENRVIRMKYIEDNDDYYTYFLKVNDVSTKGSVAPMEHVKASIKSIILNKRKTDLVKQLENDLFRKALNKNEVKINITNR